MWSWYEVDVSETALRAVPVCQGSNPEFVLRFWETRLFSFRETFPTPRFHSSHAPSCA